jgi:hypothetical protein
MQKLTVTVFASPNEKYKDQDPDPSWPVLGGIQLRLVPKVLKAAEEAMEAAEEAVEAEAEAQQAAAQAGQAAISAQQAAGNVERQAMAEASKPGSAEARSRLNEAVKEAGEAAARAKTAAGETHEAAGDIADAGDALERAAEAARAAADDVLQAEQAAADAETGAAEPGADQGFGGAPGGPDGADGAGAAPGGIEQVLLTSGDGIADGDIDAGTYVIEPLGDFAGWDIADGTVDVGDDPVDRKVVLYPPDGKWLLLLKLWGYDGGGSAFPLPAAEVVDTEGGIVRSAGDGHAYVPVPLGQVLLGFLSKSLQPGETAGQPDGGLFRPRADKVWFVVRDTPEVETADIFYGPETEVEQTAAAQIVIVPTVLVQSGGQRVAEPLIGATATITDTTPGPANTGSQTKVLASGEEILFDNLPPASYAVMVSPPAQFRDWPIKEKWLDLGSCYARPSAPPHLDAQFHFEEIMVTGRVMTSDNRLVEQDVRLEIYGESGVIRRLTVKGGTFSVPLDCGGPSKLGLGLNGEIQIDGAIPLVPQATEQPLLLPPQVNVVVLEYKYGIRGQAVDEAGNPAPGAIIDVYDDQQKEPIGSAAAGPDGSFLIGISRGGQYFIAPRTRDGAAVKRQLVMVEP